MGGVNAASVQRVWALTFLLAAWAALLTMGLASILRTAPLPSSGWPEPARPQPVVPPRGAIYAADGTPLALSLQNGDRVYPMGTLAGQVVGYVKGKRDPESGRINTAGELEAGQAGTERAMEGRLVRAGDVYLTIDPALQTFAEEALWKGVEASGAEWGTAIVMETKSGRLLAVANAPAFDPGAPRGAPGDDPRLTNYAFERLIEPGSTMKALTAAALLQAGAAGMDDVIDAPMRRKVADRTIRDVVHHPPRLSLAQVLAYSSNVGMSTFAERIDARTLTNYHRKLHLYDGDLLPGFRVWAPLYRPPEQVGEVELANLSFGQGLSVTPLHLAAAFNTLANDGAYVPPALVEPVGAPRSERVFRPEVARELRTVLSEFNAPRARLRGYDLGGKTGTAQISTGRGYEDSETYAALYAGFVPASQPRVTVLVVLYRPQTSIFGSKVAAPIFREIAARTLAYWGVPPASVRLGSGE